MIDLVCSRTWAGTSSSQTDCEFPNQEGIKDYTTVLFDQYKTYLRKELEGVLISKCIFTEPFHIHSESSKNLDLTLEESTASE